LVKILYIHNKIL